MTADQRKHRNAGTHAAARHKTNRSISHRATARQLGPPSPRPGSTKEAGSRRTHGGGRMVSPDATEGVTDVEACRGVQTGNGARQQTVGLSLALVVIIAVSGCQPTEARGLPCRRMQVEVGHSMMMPCQAVSPATFRYAYSAPVTTPSEMRYAGILEGHHVLDYYGLYCGKKRERQFSICCRVEALGGTFPEKPQPRPTPDSQEQRMAAEEYWTKLLRRIHSTTPQSVASGNRGCGPTPATTPPVRSRR
jgi:hypothetical protein